MSYDQRPRQGGKRPYVTPGYANGGQGGYSYGNRNHDSQQGSYGYENQYQQETLGPYDNEPYDQAYASLNGNNAQPQGANDNFFRGGGHGKARQRPPEQHWQQESNGYDYNGYVEPQRPPRSGYGNKTNGYRQPEHQTYEPPAQFPQSHDHHAQPTLNQQGNGYHADQDSLHGPSTQISNVDPYAALQQSATFHDQTESGKARASFEKQPSSTGYTQQDYSRNDRGYQGNIAVAPNGIHVDARAPKKSFEQSRNDFSKPRDRPRVKPREFSLSTYGYINGHLTPS